MNRRALQTLSRRLISTSSVLNKNFYDLLGIRENATKEEIREAYNALTRNYHPFTATREEVDRNERIHAAYDLLRDNERRRLYDHILARNSRMGRDSKRNSFDLPF
uniref:J domain-containing protein n=1 Tax=Steinernema glaseri TaxID=37863 RepID=A0A1I7ZZZ5_9BILA